MLVRQRKKGNIYVYMCVCVCVCRDARASIKSPYKKYKNIYKFFNYNIYKFFSITTYSYFWSQSLHTVDFDNKLYVGARGVTFIVVGNGHDDTSSNPGRD